jgi:hypothetical protein
VGIVLERRAGGGKLKQVRASFLYTRKLNVP